MMTLQKGVPKPVSGRCVEESGNISSPVDCCSDLQAFGSRAQAFWFWPLQAYKTASAVLFSWKYLPVPSSLGCSIKCCHSSLNSWKWRKYRQGYAFSSLYSSKAALR
ncbi:hypothetical protein GOP47_0023466 [Adiantum capillus-veneris]|uniref:Uncharacterized protein n=1 Tax=Adiantum capillus-veneris TaxID=13818 RepID=A0A9D4U646_ADICA|nr:hypothetical protein GOP47_0023466 [Adiantum capillus-veneris]